MRSTASRISRGPSGGPPGRLTNRTGRQGAEPTGVTPSRWYATKACGPPPSGTGPGRPSGTGLVSVGGGGQPAGRCGSTSTSRVVTVVLGGAAELVGAVVDGVEVRRASSSNPD